MTKKTIGFTLIELLVVIAIIGILASIVVVAVQEARKIARDTKRKSDLKTMQNALESYYYKNQKYVTYTNLAFGTFFSPLDKRPPCNINNTTVYWHCSTLSFYYRDLYTALVPDYLAALPTDPTNKVGGLYWEYLNNGPTEDLGYVYCTTDGKGYVLGTNLEKVTNPSTFNKYGNYQLKGGDAPTCP